MRRAILIAALLALTAWLVSSLATVRSGDFRPGAKAIDLSLREGRIALAMAPDSGLMWLVPSQRARWTPAMPKLWFEYVEDCPVGSRTSIPLWMPTALLGALCLFPPRTRRRTHPGRCPSCGYDIGIDNATTCPECGALQEPDKQPTPA